MFVSSSTSSKTSPSTSPITTQSPLTYSDTEAPDEPSSSPFPVSRPPLPCWATQALCDLARGETELRRLRDRQLVEAEVVNRGLLRAMQGVRQEERRLVERVEQDQRDAQRRLELLQRDNVAAAKAAQAQLEQRLQKITVLRQQVQMIGSEVGKSDDDEPEQKQKQGDLIMSVAEVLQPWDVSLSIQHVSFKPSSQSKPITFGEIRVQEHRLNVSLGCCGPAGQMCALHASGENCGGKVEDIQNMTDKRQSRALASPLGSGSLRVVRKIQLSVQSEEGSGGEVKPLLQKSERLTVAREECSKCDLFPALLTNGDCEGGYLGNGRNRELEKCSIRGERKYREPSPSPERGHLERDGWNRRNWSPERERRRQLSPRGIHFGAPLSPRDSFSSHSCLDLSSQDRPCSHLSLSSDDCAHGTYGEMDGFCPSLTDSMDSGCTLSSSRDNNVSVYNNARLSRSTVDLSQQRHYHMQGALRENSSPWRVHRSQLSSNSSSTGLERGSKRAEVGRTFSCPANKDLNPQSFHQHKGCQSNVCRSLSMSVIDESTQDASYRNLDRLWPDPSQRSRSGKEQSSPALVEEAEEEVAEEARLIRQFGKQGSGRSDLTLPSGVHATPQGQLFLVDCGNARVQVTDSYGNVMQQVNSPRSDYGGSSRRCRNYFDVAVNSKGLIALTCAAERALLVFNRHGRLLQTYGGGPIVGGASPDGLEAPRGVTVTQQQEFLVADLRRGTLTALKLDPKTGSRLERTVVTGFDRPYLVAACQHSGLVAVSERGSETGREPCVKVLDPGWTTLKVLGVCPGMGPVLSSPWGICIDHDGAVLVADWAERHRVVLYPAQGIGRVVVSDGLSSPRGLALLPSGSLVVSDSMHHCIKLYQYK